MSEAVKNQQVLVIDDNSADAVLLNRCFRKEDIDVGIKVLENGEIALEHLEDCLSKDGTGLPSLILLDVNMPRMDGREFLKIINRRNILGNIPIIVMSNSTINCNIEEFEKLGAHSFMLKPKGIAKVKELVHYVRGFLQA